MIYRISTSLIYGSQTWISAFDYYNSIEYNVWKCFKTKTTLEIQIQNWLENYFLKDLGSFSKIKSSLLIHQSFDLQPFKPFLILMSIKKIKKQYQNWEWTIEDRGFEPTINSSWFHSNSHLNFSFCKCFTTKTTLEIQIQNWLENYFLKDVWSFKEARKLCQSKLNIRSCYFPSSSSSKS